MIPLRRRRRRSRPVICCHKLHWFISVKGRRSTVRELLLIVP